MHQQGAGAPLSSPHSVPPNAPTVLSHQARQAMPLGQVGHGSAPNGQFYDASTDQQVEAVQYQEYVASPISTDVRVDGGVNRGDRRAAIEQRLRELGAVYSLLEMWGRDGTRYRYHCRVALAGGAQATRNFEIVGTDPETVMQQVLSEVEAWRSLAAPQGVDAP